MDDPALAARATAAAGVFVAALLASGLWWWAQREIARWHGRPLLGFAMMMVPTVAVLIATSVRHYGLWRACVVAVGTVALSVGFSLVARLFGLAAGMTGSGIGVVFLVASLAAPLVAVVFLGILALRNVPPRPRR